jgi:hypothetical protein
LAPNNEFSQSYRSRMLLLGIQVWARLDPRLKHAERTE